MSDIYGTGAERLWGQAPAASEGMGVAPQEVGMMARQLTDEALAAEAQIKEHLAAVRAGRTTAQIPQAQLDLFAHWMNSWTDFCQNISGQRGTLATIFSITSGRYYAESFLLRWRAGAIFNQVREYRRKYNAIWEMISKSLGRQLTPYTPAPVPDPVTDESIGDKIIKGVLGLGAIVTGGWLLSKVIFKPKRVRRVVPSAEVEVVEEE